MKNFIKIGFANLAGFVAAMAFLFLFIETTRNEGGYMMSYAGLLGLNAGKFGAWYGPVQFSIIFASFLVLAVSFVVTHLVEKLLAWKTKDDLQD